MLCTNFSNEKPMFEEILIRESIGTKQSEQKTLSRSLISVPVRFIVISEIGNTERGVNILYYAFTLRGRYSCIKAHFTKKKKPCFPLCLENQLKYHVKILLFFDTLILYLSPKTSSSLQGTYFL